MSSESLLNKERDFLELNKELEEKVQSLMSEVDSIINRQEDVIRSPARSLSRKKKARMKQTQSLTELEEEKLNLKDWASKDRFFEKLAKSTSVEEKTTEDEYETDNDDCRMKKKKKRTTKETIIRFLQAQVIKLQTDVQAAQFETKKKNDRCKELEAELKKEEEKKEKLLNQITVHKESITKIDLINSEFQTKIQAQNNEIASLKREVEVLKKELKSANQVSANNDLRLNRSLEENEKLRMSLKTCQSEEKDLREQIRKIQEEKRIALKNADKQRTDIVQALKKQSQLVDNLKKQKAYLEASKEIQFIEDDFTRLLEWKLDK